MPVGTPLSGAAVEQAPAPRKAEPDPSRSSGAGADSVARVIKIDPATQQVIYQAVDRSSGEVVRQVPEEAILRLRIYARAMRRAESDPHPTREKSYIA